MLARLGRGGFHRVDTGPRYTAERKRAQAVPSALIEVEPGEDASQLGEPFETGGQTAEQRSRRHSPVIPKLKGLHSPDLGDLRAPELEDPRNFCVLIQAFIGPKGQAGPGGEPAEESFDFMVCTHEWLAEYLTQNAFLWGRHYLFLDHYDYDVIRDQIERLCRRATGYDTWGEVAERLSRYGHWEFEDYEENQGGA